MWKEYRPKIDLPKTTFQKRLNIIGYSVFIAATIFSIVSLFSLPAEVPIHFNFAGEADGWGSKYILLLLPFIGLVTCLPMEALEKKPDMHNYPSRINESNVHAFYALSVRTMNVLKNSVLIIFALLQIEVVLAAKESSFSFSPYLIVIIIAITVLPIIWHLMSTRKIQ